MYIPSRLHPDEHGQVGKGIKFERIRRVTGYLTGSLERFNDAKYSEVKDRVVHQSFKTFHEIPSFVHNAA